MDPRLGFTIWKFEIRYYALIIILGALVAGAIAAWRAKKNGRDPPKSSLISCHGF